LIGADIIKDEITAHKTGATFVGERLINRTPDTIFEIGGQDSKFISIQEGIVVDFTMNEACAAGTGSFLEEQAERMGINIVGEFAQLALSSKSPIRLGERCTVFMEKEIGPYLQRGVTKEDLCAGLAYSIAINYLNRVVRGRKIGDRIFFQGGTAYNDSVAAAFATLLDKEIIVPPYNGVIGAIGAALLAMEKVKAFKTETKFRGFDLSKVKYELRVFTCRGCSNFCEIQQFKVENEVTYWGDKCSDRFRKHIKSEREPVIPDIMRARQELLLREYEPDKHDGAKIGFPRAMYFYDRFPFWAKLLDELGLNLVISDPTNRKIIKAGVDSAVAEPCFPIKVAHGHVADLLDKGVDFVLIPNVINAETEFPEVNSHLCPWGQTMTYVIGHSPLMEGREEMILRPRIHFRDGMEKVKREIYEGLSRRFKISRRRSNRAVEAAYEAQRRFEEDLLKIGIEAIEKLEETGELGIILIGRPYNINDSGINLDVPRKLRDYYGVNVIPYDALPLKGIDISDVDDNMYWHYGRKILQAAKFVRDRQNLHLIYISNFKCGPDSYIKHFVLEASGKPYLTLQLDEHANDAGIITRIEAYLDSKGFLRWWAREKVA
ncbi:TPA: CoA activase, partial [Candidatus Poribacteria bacterium]|nr:CoA activase [Candidatus Poribacteria bacterium]HEX29260.1 CoA activase [Candidatus Poribacteria bacterium]